MAKVSTYLNFAGQTAEAFAFYREIFQTDYLGKPLRVGEVGSQPGMPAVPEQEKQYIMHIALPILGGHVLMGTDVLESMGHKIALGNNVSINLETDSRVQTERLFKALGKGGEVTMPLGDTFWGAYFGTLVDRFGVRWMFNCNVGPER